jgi:hypothetical protein
MRRSVVPSPKVISLFVLLGLAFCPRVSAQFNPIQAAKDAYNKAKQQQQQGQQQGQQQSQPQTSSQPANSSGQPASAAGQPGSAPAQPAATPAASPAASAPWTPPSDTPSAATVPAGPLDPSKLPDISGLHLGMSLAEATAQMKKWYPKGVGVMNGGPYGPQHQTAVGVLRATGDFRDAAAVDLTGPPNQQVVWNLSRDLLQPKVAHNVVVAALRQKYGKETFAAGPGGTPVTDDTQIQHMWWVFDEQGHLAPQAKIIGGSPFGCGSFYSTDGSWHTYQKIMLGQDTGLPTYCLSSYVGVEVVIAPLAILEDINVNVVDLTLMVRSAKASATWVKGQDDKARQEDLQRSQQLKPQL